MKSQLAALCLVLACLPTLAQVRCSNEGDPPARFDPTLAPKMVAWLSNVLRTTGIIPPDSKGKTLDVAILPIEQLQQLQAILSPWRRSVPRASSEWFFREAMGHALNAQYETTMLRLEPEKAKDHAFFRDLEAARANACLALTRPQ